MFEAVAGEFGGTTVHEELLDVDAPESALVEAFDELRERFDVAVGSYPGESVRVKIRGEDPETVRDAADWFERRVDRRVERRADGATGSD